ncbi:hypothetical protein B0T14DRAFT_582975 [Immersiella caudata]|uniref:J domain-containing protein n=1 Tax=Immersiella caudata TaxID=314043 RepID=A0AA39WZ83_9PEZI|nr:hypothetical protein B0T14DRAFT_582975 [Immersiella caudata]
MIRPKKYHVIGAKTYYEVLGLTPNAEKAEVRKAFLLTSKKTHPDKLSNTPEANLAFSNVHDAYEILYDQKERAEYDGYLARVLTMGLGAPPAPPAPSPAPRPAAPAFNFNPPPGHFNPPPGPAPGPAPGRSPRAAPRAAPGFNFSTAPGFNPGPAPGPQPGPQSFPGGPREPSPSPGSDSPAPRGRTHCHAGTRDPSPSTSSSSDSSMDPEPDYNFQQDPLSQAANAPQDPPGRICHRHLPSFPNFDERLHLQHGQAFLHGGPPAYCLCTPCAEGHLVFLNDTLKQTHRWEAELHYVRFFTHWHQLREIYRPLRRRRGYGAFPQCISCLKKAKCDCFDLRSAKKMVLAIANFVTKSIAKLEKPLLTHRARQEAMCPECHARAGQGDPFRGFAVTAQDMEDAKMRLAYMQRRMGAVNELRNAMAKLLKRAEDDGGEISNITFLKHWWAGFERFLRGVHLDLPGKGEDDGNQTGDEIEVDINSSFELADEGIE